jgi:hypothetical protein
VKLRILFALFALFCWPLVTATQAQKKDGGVKNQYKNIEVVKFDVKEGIEFPADYLTGMIYETVMALQRLKRFEQVLHEGETQTDAVGPTIRLTGTVTKYQAGSRAKRYLIGFGAGKTRIVTHITFIDKATGKMLYETDASGAVSWGVFGGESKVSLGSLGKKIAEITRHEFF